jgi:hypothetical protein
MRNVTWTESHLLAIPMIRLSIYKVLMLSQIQFCIQEFKEAAQSQGTEDLYMMAFISIVKKTNAQRM